ncbi:Protein T2, partial [Xenoophorus captivus]
MFCWCKCQISRGPISCSILRHTFTFVLQNDSPAMKKAVSLLSLTTPNSNRKRRRLRDTLAQLTKETEISPFPPPRKRPSAEHSLSIGSLLDISNTPESCKALA